MQSKSKILLLIVMAVSAVIFCVTALTAKNDMQEELYLTIRNVESGQIYAQYPYEEGDKCSITFIHSINKTPVTEGYIFCRDRVILDYSLYYSFGAGVATEIPAPQMLSYTSDGGMLISNMQYEIPELIYFVGTISDHVLNLYGQDISLRELCGKSSKVSFALEPKQG